MDDNPILVIASLVFGAMTPMILVILALVFWNGPSSLAWWEKREKNRLRAPEESPPVREGRYR